MKTFKVAVASSSFSKSTELLDKLKSYPVQVHINSDGKKLNEDQLIEFLNKSDAEIAIIGLEPFSRKVVKHCPHIKIVCKYGVGIDNLDVHAMKEAGIQLGWTPGVNRRSVSELALAFALGHFRNVFTSIARMREGHWVKNGGRQLSNVTVGIVGFGYIGTDLASLLKPFGCEIFVCDILDKKKEAAFYGAKQVSYEELIKKSGMISFHVPNTDDTHTMYGAKEISWTAPETLIVNTSRGHVVDFNAVCSAVKKGHLGGFASDVFPEEPFDASHLKEYPHFYFTPHIGGNARESVLAMGSAALDHLAEYLGKK